MGMSIQVPITPRELRQLRKAILSGQPIICSNRSVYVKCLLVGQQLLREGNLVDVKKISLSNVGGVERGIAQGAAST